MGACVCLCSEVETHKFTESSTTIMNAPDDFDATDRRQADIMALASALHEIRQTIECLHTDILNLASAQEETASRLKSLEFERNCCPI